MRACFVLWFALAMMIPFTRLAAGEAEFGYSGDSGPAFWGELDAKWSACNFDKRQTPIDLSNARLDKTLKPLKLDLRKTPLELINNGHTIEQEYKEGSTLNVDGVVYQLLQFHFHTLSEHTVGGVRYPMELHAVFKDSASGNLAVIGMFFQFGRKNEFLAQFDYHLPRKSGDRYSSEDHINIADGLTETSSYFTYPGSLTTPPCSPIVTWLVLKSPADMSEEQFHALQSILGNNFRPLQPHNNRVVRTTGKPGAHTRR